MLALGEAVSEVKTMMVLSRRPVLESASVTSSKHVLHRFQLLLAFPEPDSDLFDVLFAGTEEELVEEQL